MIASVTEVTQLGPHDGPPPRREFKVTSRVTGLDLTESTGLLEAFNATPFQGLEPGKARIVYVGLSYCSEGNWEQVVVVREEPTDG